MALQSERFRSVVKLYIVRRASGRKLQKLMFLWLISDNSFLSLSGIVQSEDLN